MKYTIEGFSQEYALTLTKQVEEKGKLKTVKVDCIDLIILRWFVDFYPKMTKVEIDGVQYAWLNYKKLLDDMPLLDMGKHMLAIRLQKLCEFGILTHKNIKCGGNFSYYGFGANYHNLIEKPCATDEHLMQDNAEPCATNCTTLVQNNAEPCAISCNTNNSSTKDSSAKDSSTKKEKKVSKATSFDEIIGEYTQNEALKISLVEFVKMRSLNKRQPLTSHGLDLLLKKLDKLGQTDAQKIEIVDQSVMRGWAGFFAVNEGNKPKQDKPDEKPKEEPKVYAHPFDDGSDPEYTRRCLEAQKRRGW